MSYPQLTATDSKVLTVLEDLRNFLDVVRVMCRVCGTVLAQLMTMVCIDQRDGVQSPMSNQIVQCLIKLFNV